MFDTVRAPRPALAADPRLGRLSEWKAYVTRSLEQVQATLEALEEAGIRHRDVVKLGRSRFAVVWK